MLFYFVSEVDYVVILSVNTVEPKKPRKRILGPAEDPNKKLKDQFWLIFVVLLVGLLHSQFAN